MADTPLAAFFEHKSAYADIHEVGDRKPTRLTGDLAVDEVIAASGQANEKVRVKGASRVMACVKFSGSGTGLVTLTSILADGSTKSANTSASDGAGPADTEIVVTMDLYGEAYLDIDVTEDGTSDSITITYVDVFIL